MKRVMKNRLTGFVAPLALLLIAAPASAADDSRWNDRGGGTGSGARGGFE